MNTKQLKELAEKSKDMSEQELQEIVDKMTIDEALQLFEYVMKNY